MCLSIPDFKQYKYENMNIMNNRKAAPGINPPSNPTRPKERKISIRHPLFLHSPFSILHSLRFVLLCLFLPATSISIGQVPGTPYGVLSPDCLSAPATPGPIALSTAYVPEDTAFIASISPVDGATSYEWELAEGLNGSSSGPSIVVTADTFITVTAAHGTYGKSAITVKAVNDCDLSSADSLAVTFEAFSPGTSNILRGFSPMCLATEKKAKCTCAIGTEVWYGFSSNAQKAKAAYYFEAAGGRWWFAVRDHVSSSGDGWASHMTETGWFQDWKSEGYAACFD
jgi:hypothetical protein